MNEAKWVKIQEAYKTVENGICNKIEGDDFTIYRVGKIIRIDIKDNA